MGSTTSTERANFMRHWWVNQNKTYRHEVPGGYLWSPKRKSNGHLNPYYETMREVAPGDLVFSFADTCIRAFGIVRRHAYEAPKPTEFGSAGRDWDDIGWRVDVGFHEIATNFRPSQWMERLRPLLPKRYSPLLADGRGVQNLYLALLPEALAFELADLLGREIASLARGTAAPPLLSDSISTIPEVMTWEEHLRQRLEADPTLDETEKQAVVLARRGQGLFRDRVQRIETHCRITRVERPEHLRASHCKPWRDASNEERLSGDNGLLLTPSIDHLFDRGFISFEDDGELLVSPVADRPSLTKMGVVVDRRVDVGPFRAGQLRYLEYHRDAVFLQSRKRAAG